MAFSKIGIIGTGTMGTGVAQACATAGKSVIIVKATPGPVDKARDGLATTLAKAVERGKADAETRDFILGNITFVPVDEIGQVADCDLVIESIIEKLEPKQALFKQLEEICKPEALLTTNTSALPVTSMMAACEKRDRVAGLHFFNPAPVMRLVEVVHAFETSEDTIRELMAFCREIDKEPVLVQDSTGFIVNRLLCPFIMNAIRMLERGVGTVDSIDQAMVLGAGHPMGPLALADYIGLDVVQALAQNIYDDVRSEHHAPAHTLVRLVQLGYLGRKTGKGFYDYSVRPPVPNKGLTHPVI
ncbi:MAG: 3-hydroxyacyl-CoA dehydrogenase family protein [Magnetospiraceae bacterium]